MQVAQFKNMFDGMELKHQKRTFENMGTKEQFIEGLKSKNPTMAKEVVEELEKVYDHCEKTVKSK